METSKITKRSDDYSQWYLDVIAHADLADYAPVKGCMVVKPNGFAIWENIQSTLDAMFKSSGVQNAYFPLLIPESLLKREAEHVEGFAPECAVVTEAGGKKLEEPLVIRPTSETIIYEMFSRWISSYRDLPMVLNQWANIVRWEKRTRLFLRTSEFLWQEGHTAHATEAEAKKRTLQMLEVYRVFAEDYLAIPVIAGQKSESEKFAGAERTYSIEAMMQDGKALQSGTSHLLDEKFTSAFNIKYLDADGKEKNIRATSWGVSTRLVGALIMAHSDDNGLVLPPKIAPIQVVIIPIWTNESEKEVVLSKAKSLSENLNQKLVRVKIDEREMRPGPKFFDWEKRGVPIRVEIGPKDVASKSMIMVRRDLGEKETVGEENVEKRITEMLDDIQKTLFDRALALQKSKTKEVNDFDELKAQVEIGFAVGCWCGNSDCEEEIKNQTKATIRCIPFDQPTQAGKCVVCGKGSKNKAIFARAY